MTIYVLYINGKMDSLYKTLAGANDARRMLESEYSGERIYIGLEYLFD